MRAIILGAFMAIVGFQSCQNPPATIKQPKGMVFPGGEYVKAVAYHYEGNDGGNIIEKGVLNDSIYKQVELSKQQAEKFVSVMNSSDSYGGEPARCFKPHLGVVFYDAKNTAVAYTSICFMCNNQNTSPSIQAEKQAPSIGFSEEGRRQLLEFCQSLEFGHCGDANRGGGSSGEEEEEEDNY